MQDLDYLLHQIRLLIIPVVQKRYIYIVVVDIKDPDFVIIDNSNFVQDISARYGQLPVLLKRYLVGYLCSVSHPIVDALSVIAHQLQLNRLRVKYLYKILANEYNLRKAAIENEVLEYMKIPAGERKQIKENAAANIYERLSRNDRLKDNTKNGRTQGISTYKGLENGIVDRIWDEDAPIASPPSSFFLKRHTLQDLQVGIKEKWLGIRADIL
ncbi:hypothetical protein L2E82_30809 [Cichorium intybus]|uniref:Uncharacterized protein n=1 Tax=Cichorium intybus TaxID=13427 RepID=A0ACB9D1V4_CICIN|nr:hypothetical protein L2E82_30809 [Cichorium intybus]